MPKAKESTKRKSKQVKEKYSEIPMVEHYKNLFDAEVHKNIELTKKAETYRTLGLEAAKTGLEVSLFGKQIIKDVQGELNRAFIRGIFLGSILASLSWLLGNLLFK